MNSSELLVRLTDHIHGVVTSRLPDCPDTDGSSLCFDIAESLLEVAWREETS
ncbi:MAG: hypothetical protein JWO67_4486 [Streptosporangiaceae bacterium]|nr:hypothetical protein [Streptosporangiaceae bacterium]